MVLFLIVVAALALALPLVVRWIWIQGWVPEVPSFLFESTWLMAIITVVIFSYLYKLKRPEMFVQLYLLSMVVKLIAALGYCLLVVLDDGSGSTANLIYFLVVYLLFTALEIIFLYRRIAR